MVKQRQIRPSSNRPDVENPSDTPSLGERIWDATGHIGKELPEGMEPKGDGWYGSPDVIDPRDCDNYPDSIYCGGNPLSDPREGIQLDIDWGINECGAWAKAQGKVFGFGLPTHTRAWVREECRQDYERKELDRKHPPPEPPPDWRNGGWEPTPQYRPSGFRPDDRVCVVTIDTKYQEYQEYFGEDYGWGVASFFSTGIVDSCDYPSESIVNLYNYPFTPVVARASVRGIATNHQFANAQWVWFNRMTPVDQANSEYPPSPAYSDYEQNVLTAIEPDRRNGNQFRSDLDYQKNTFFFTGEAFTDTIAIYVGRFGDIFPNYQVSPVQYGIGSTKDRYGREIERSLLIHERSIRFCIKLDGKKPPKRPHRDSPRPPEKDCCMACCSSQSQRDPNDDLAKILKELKDIKRVIGYEEYPVKVPATFNRELKEDGSRVNPPVIQIPNMTQFQGWMIKTLDAVLGDWEVGFEFKDLDPTKEGDQPGRIVTPNVSALLTEMFSLVFDMWLMQYQQTHLAQRHAGETMLAKKITVQNNYLLDAIADFLGFKRDEKKLKIPFLFNLDSEKLEDFIKNSEKEILIQEYEPDKKNNPSFRDEMLIMRMMASIIKAVHTRNFDPNGDIAQQIKNHLRKLSDNTEKVNKNKYRTTEGEFEQWLREAENAFVTHDPSPTDPTKPYGVPLEQRPRLKKITDSTPEDPATP